MILPFGLPIISALALSLFIEHIRLRVCSVAIRIVHLLEIRGILRSYIILLLPMILS